MENMTTLAEEDRFDELFNKTRKQYAKVVDMMYGEKKLDMQEVERLFGQMEFAVEIHGDTWLRGLLAAGKVQLMDLQMKI